MTDQAQNTPDPSKTITFTDQSRYLSAVQVTPETNDVDAAFAITFTAHAEEEIFMNPADAPVNPAAQLARVVIDKIDATNYADTTRNAIDSVTEDNIIKVTATLMDADLQGIAETLLEDGIIEEHEYTQISDAIEAAEEYQNSPPGNVVDETLGL